MRSVSIARFLAIERSHVDTRPRLASYDSACCQARTKVSWATSSAAPGSPRIVTASPKTLAWKRRTNAAAASGSPDASPAKSDSSDSDHTWKYEENRLRDCTPV